MTNTTSRVQECVKDIRALYDYGRTLRDRTAPRTALARRAKAFLAGLMDSSRADMDQKAKKFAELYTPEEVEDLCELITEANVPVGRSHVVRLLSVPRESRGALQQSMVKKKWTLRQLEQEIARRFGARKAGGRIPRVSADTGGLLTQLEWLCEKWRRLCVQLVVTDEHGEYFLTVVPEVLQEPLREARGAVERLQVQIEEELKTRSKRRTARYPRR